jgi:tripartite-type tricarboxylate transporter receptor subunit TctC
VKIIVGFAPGGTADVTTRVLAAGAEKYLKQPIVIENKGGAAGTVALAIVANAPPDGYTLCSVPNDCIVSFPLMNKVPFKPLKSFTPILTYAYAGHSGLLVKNDAPWKTLKDFLDYSKKNPGKVKYSYGATGMRIGMEVIAHKEGIKWVPIPFKGNAPAVTALLGGHVDACSAGCDFPPYVLSGDARVLVTHGEGKRLAIFPNVPTLKELGYGYAKQTMHSIVGPAGLPANIVKVIETALSKGMETPEFKKVLEKLYLLPVHYNSQEYDRYLKEYWVSAEKMYKDFGLIKEAATKPY